MGSVYGLSNQTLSENFGVEDLNIDLIQINEDMAEAILSTVTHSFSFADSPFTTMASTDSAGH